MIHLRDAYDTDMELVMAWRSHPDNYKGFFTQKKALTWEEHKAWWYSRSSEWKMFIICLDGRSVGMLNVGWLQSWTPEIGVCVGETTLQGKGVGREAILQALEWLRERGYGHVHTTILKNNDKSLRAFQGVGFKILGDAREGEWWLTKTL